MLGISDGDHGVHLLDQLLFLVIIELHVPLGQACLACPVLDKDEADLEQAGEEVREVGTRLRVGTIRYPIGKMVGPRVSL